MAGCGCNHPFIKKNASPPLAGGPLALAGSPDGIGAFGEDAPFTEKPMGVVAVGALVGVGIVGLAFAYKALAKR